VREDTTRRAIRLQQVEQQRERYAKSRPSVGLREHKQQQERSNSGGNEVNERARSTNSMIEPKQRNVDDGFVPVMIDNKMGCVPINNDLTRTEECTCDAIQ
jgi:hypothetical protein